jgi:hypothetical protein
MYWYICMFMGVMKGLNNIKFASEACDKPQKESASHRPLKTR